MLAWFLLNCLFKCVRRKSDIIKIGNIVMNVCRRVYSSTWTYAELTFLLLFHFGHDGIPFLLDQLVTGETNFEYWYWNVLSTPEPCWFRFFRMTETSIILKIKMASGNWAVSRQRFDDWLEDKYKTKHIRKHLSVFFHYFIEAKAK